MAGINKVEILGRLGGDPEVRYTQSGSAVANISLATSEKWKDQQGNEQERTEWHRVVMFGRTAEIAGQYLRKGDQALVIGKLQTRKWEKDGVDHYTTEIVVDGFDGRRLHLLGSARNDNGQQQPQQRPQQQRQAPHQPRNDAPSRPQSAPPAQDYDSFDDDIPF